MDKPGRQELRKAYEDLADEILMDIYQNIDQEYEAAAVEVAKAVLDERGVNISKLNDISAGKASLSGDLLEIPGFSAEETIAIEEIFNENRLPYEKRPAAAASCSSCDCSEYVFHVPKDSFASAIDLLKEYYNSGAEKSLCTFSGTCPACGTDLSNVEECSDCGLTLAVDHSKLIENHPFIKFLKNNSLLS